MLAAMGVKKKKNREDMQSRSGEATGFCMGRGRDVVVEMVGVTGKWDCCFLGLDAGIGIDIAPNPNFSFLHLHRVSCPPSLNSPSLSVLSFPTSLSFCSCFISMNNIIPCLCSTNLSLKCESIYFVLGGKN